VLVVVVLVVVVGAVVVVVVLVVVVLVVVDVVVVLVVVVLVVDVVVVDGFISVKRPVMFQLWVCVIMEVQLSVTPKAPSVLKNPAHVHPSFGTSFAVEKSPSLHVNVSMSTEALPPFDG
jgi:hypothetical protein